MKKQTKRKIGAGTMMFLMGTTILAPAIIAACGEKPGTENTNDDNVVKERSMTINLFEGKTATVKGVLDKKGLEAAAGKIGGAFASTIKNAPDPIKEAVKTKYGKCNFIFVEATSEYNSWKTVGDGQTIYINLNVLDSAELEGIIGLAIASMDLGKTEMAKAIDNGRNTVRVASVGASRQHLKPLTNPKKIRRAERAYLAVLDAKNDIVQSADNQLTPQYN